ncbi:hypothetical protein PFISCL1PPCAC_15720, partial [Pristionchus fissidentatus]
GRWRNGKELNARRLAERGWRLVDASKQTIKCDSCGFYLNTALPDVASVDLIVYNRCLREVHESVDTCHEKTCTAKSRRPNFFTHLNEKSELSDELRSRLETMKEMKMPEGIEITEDGIETKDLLEIFPDESIDITMKKLAITGWEKHDYSSVRCCLCLRTLSLTCSFTPSSSHHSWCPFLDPHDPLDIPQWRVAYDTVVHKKTSLSDSLSIVRRSLNSSLITSTNC